MASLALLGLLGCSEQRDTPVPIPTAPEAAAPVRERPTEVEMVASMEAHYGVVILAHDALLQGDLATFQSQLGMASGLGLPPNAPARWLPFHERLQSATRQGANATDLAAAADALARVVLACGTCHAELGAGPIYPAPSPDEGDTLVESAMLEHQWATERLWEGVTGPWDDAWLRGADSLALSDVFANADPNLVLSDELRRREEELRQLGEEAKITTAIDARAALYGRLLATCGECHRLIGVKAGGP